MELQELNKFIANISLERFQTHASNDAVSLTEKSAELQGNVWTAGILWGNEQIKGIILVHFTTLNILALANDVFKDTDDTNLFEHAKDFMKEFCNFYAGFIKGTFKNNGIDVTISLPFITSQYDVKSCLGGQELTSFESWQLGVGSGQVIIENHLSIHDDFKMDSLEFLKNKESNKPAKAGKVEFF